MDVVVAKPRGFCAGVDRAIKVVEVALETYGAPVYVRKQIVHNSHVVARLAARGAVFVEELADVRRRRCGCRTGSARRRRCSRRRVRGGCG